MPRQKSTHVDNPVEVGRRLREARLRAGLSQTQLSFPGCSTAYISRIEAGTRTPSLQLLRELGRRLGVSADYLATGVDEPERAERGLLLDAEVALRLDETETAARLYQEALERATTTEGRACALAGLGQLAFREGDPHGAIARLERALAVSGWSDTEHAALADTLGRAYATVGELDRAIGLFQRCLAAAEAREDVLEAIRFSVLLSNALVDSAGYAEAEVLLGKALARADELRDPLLHARLYWAQSRLHAYKGNAATAARHARKALQILELTEHTHYTARAHQLLAFIELDRGRAVDALALLQRGRELLGQRGSRLEQAKFSLEEARALAQLGRAEEAAALAMEASGLLAHVDPADAARGYGLLGEIFEGLGDGPRAIELYELAIEQLELTGKPYVMDIYSRLAEVLEAEGRKDEALDVLKRALGARPQGVRQHGETGR